ncbi:hypothetical protein AA0111_g12704 [Alternaria arborescens]|nr:hypothetical protein AA0111_g12704 [Alternaria arborescens]RYO11826.1 hypothetical protein AA0111_g12704 [Alternaria arborescens]
MTRIVKQDAYGKEYGVASLIGGEAVEVGKRDGVLDSDGYR